MSMLYGLRNVFLATKAKDTGGLRARKAYHVIVSRTEAPCELGLEGYSSGFEMNKSRAPAHSHVICLFDHLT